MTRVLVTGCAGFIGSNLCASLLQAGHTVVGIDDLSAGRREHVPDGVQFVEADIRDADAGRKFAGVEVVFHLAAKNCLPECAAQPVATAAINVEGTVRVLEACRAARVRKIVYADTSAEYEGIERLPTPESAVAPVGTYAVSKRAGALFVESHAKLHGLAFTVLRYFNVYGPAQDYRRAVPPVMSAFILHLLDGRRPTIYGDGEKRRDFVHVEDVNRMHRLVLTDPRSDGLTLNVGTGVHYTVREVFDMVARLLGSDVQPLYAEDLDHEAQATLADVTAARRLGFEPRVSLEAGLKSMIAYLRAETGRE